MPRTARRFVAFVCSLSVLAAVVIVADEQPAPAAEAPKAGVLRDGVLSDLAGGAFMSPDSTIAVTVGLVENAPPGIDTLEDYRAFVRRANRR